MTDPKDSPRRTKTRSNGEGSLFPRHKPDCKRPTGPKGDPRCKCPWQAVFTEGTRFNKAGEVVPRRYKVSGATRQAAVAAMKAKREEVGATTLPALGKSITVAEWMRYWFGTIAPREVKPLTLAGYNAKVRQYIIPLLGHHRLDKLTPEHIEDAWDTLRDHGNPTKADPKPLSANTIHQTHRILAHALRVAMQRKRLAANPAGPDSMKAPSKVEQEIVPMKDAEVDAILAACRGTWNAARWSVALAIGLRQGEALGMRWEDVDFDEGTVTIRQTLMRLTGRGLVFGTPKSATSRRVITLPASLLASLKAHRTEQNAARLHAGSAWVDSGLVFTMEDGRPIDPSLDATRWRKLLESAGVKHYRLHDARHSAATMMLGQGVDLRVVMSILGHSQVSLTMRYQHAVEELRADAAGKMDQAGRWA